MHTTKGRGTMRKRTSTVAKLAIASLCVLVLLGLSYAVLSSSDTYATRLFVAVPIERNAALPDLIATELQRHGLKTSLSHATDDRGNTDTVLRARGGNVSFWMGSVVLSGQDPTVPCERRPEAYSDPRQFEVRLRSRVRFFPSHRLPQILSDLQDLFRHHGVPYQQGPWPCGAAAFLPGT